MNPPLGAGAAVAAFVQLAELLGVHEYVLSFFVSSIGTSLPELVVDVTALRAGPKDLALGDVLGSSFVDATLSIGIGPALFPAEVTAELAVLGAGMALVAIVLMALTLSVRETHDWVGGTALILVYVGRYFCCCGSTAATPHGDNDPRGSPASRFTPGSGKKRSPLGTALPGSTRQELTNHRDHRPCVAWRTHSPHRVGRVVSPSPTHSDLQAGQEVTQAAPNPSVPCRA